jgi:hypothetical protein
MKEPWQFLSNTSLAVMFFFPQGLSVEIISLNKHFWFHQKILP